MEVTLCVSDISKVRIAFILKIRRSSSTARLRNVTYSLALHSGSSHYSSFPLLSVPSTAGADDCCDERCKLKFLDCVTKSTETERRRLVGRSEKTHGNSW